MPQIFVKRTRLTVSAERVYAWHAEPGALEKLIPPWGSAEVTERTGSVNKIGSRVVIRMRLGPFRCAWTSVHTACEPGRMFRDSQVSGPFAEWTHTHSFIPETAESSWLEDRVEYTLPFGALGQFFAGWYVRRKLKRMFDYRHRVTLEAFANHSAGMQ